jgi:hypothetical protein
LSACAVSPVRIDRVETKFVQVDGAAPAKQMVVTISSDDPRWSRSKLARVSRLFICGHDQRYSEGARLVVKPGQSFVAEASFPHANADRRHFQPDGKVTSGWPEDLVNRSGVCFEAHIVGKPFPALTSGSIRISEP